MDYPAEILYQIVATVVAEHLDDLIAGRLSLRDAKEPDAVRQNEPYTDLLASENPILPLLEVSFKVRDTTLLVLSDTLGIARNEDGRLSSNPWSPIAKLRLLFHPSLNTQNSTAILFTDILDLYTSSSVTACYVSLAVSEATLANANEAISDDDARLLRCNYFATMLTRIPQEPLREVMSRRCAEFVQFSEVYIMYSWCSNDFRQPFEALSSYLNMISEDIDPSEVEKENAKLVGSLVQAMQDNRDEFVELQALALAGLSSPFFQISAPDVETRHEKYQTMFEETRMLLNSIRDFPSPHPDYDTCREIAQYLLTQWPFRHADHEEPSASWMDAICGAEYAD